MSCSKWVEQISRMIDGSLAAGDLERLEEHLAECPACRAEVLLQRKIESALGVKAHSGLSADFVQRVGAKVTQIEKQALRTRPWLVLVPPLATAAALIGLFVMFLNLADQSPSLFEPVAGSLVKPLAWMSQAMAGFADAVAQLQLQYFPSFTEVSGSVGSMIAVILVGAIPALWGFKRIFVYFR